jgi:flagellar biogenesis protein FliO
MHFFLILTSLSQAVLAAQSAQPTPEFGFLGKPLADLQQTRGPVEAPSLLPTLLNIGLSLVIVLLLAYLFLWLLKRWQASRQASGDLSGADDQPLRVLDRTWIDNKRGVALVEAAGEILVIGIGDDVTLLSKISEPSQVERLRSSSGKPSLLGAFPQQFDKVASLLRQKQWSKNRKTLKVQADQLKDQTEKMRNLGSREEN